MHEDRSSERADRQAISDLVALSVRHCGAPFPPDVLEIFEDPQATAELVATLARELMRVRIDLTELEEIIAGRVLS